MSGTSGSKKSSPLNPLDLKRAVLAWLLPQQPTGFGVGVPTRISRFQADIAAFWSIRRRRRLLVPEHTMIVEIRHTREQCWPDCSRKEELLSLLKEKKQWLAELQEGIRVAEPHLKDTDDLFDEFETWNYADSENPDYRRCAGMIEEIEHALYKGSRFEQIRRGNVADFLYLAVPKGVVSADELADGWGLLTVDEKFEIEVVKTAGRWDCPEINRLHLIQNIARVNSRHCLFAHGVRVSKDGSVTFLPLPRRRRGRSK